MEPFLDATETPDDLVAVVRRQMAAVSEIYKRVILQQQARESEQVPEFALQGEVEAVVPDTSRESIMARLAVDAPELHEIVKNVEGDSITRRNLMRFLSAALTSSQRYAEVVRRPGAVAQAIPIFRNSEYLMDILVRHPEEIATLAQLESAPSVSGNGYLFDGILGDERVSEDPVMGYLAGATGSEAEKLSLLRRHYRHRIFAEGTRDLLVGRDVYSALRATTAAAEDAIDCAFRMAGNPTNVAVLALGRLGTQEFDLCSDADLLFVCEQSADLACLSHVVERIVRILAAYTHDGPVFAVDTRLRPRGEAGDLLVTVPQLQSYFANEAQAWEGLLYTKLRFVAGDRGLGAQCVQTTSALFEKLANSPGVIDELREMRTRLEQTGEEKNFKMARGGTYDIDFVGGYLLLKHGIPRKNGTLRDRLWRCAAAGLLEKRDAARLDHAAELLRTTEHMVRLVTGRAEKWLPATEHARARTAELVDRVLPRPSVAHALEAELQQTCEEVRSIYDRVLSEGK
jgi:glutamine synthetase adenylyltransferase